MTEGTYKREHVRWYVILIFFCVLIAFMLTVSLLTMTHVPELMTPEDLSSCDFSQGAAKLSRDLFDFYPEHLYSPEDFASGTTEPPEFTYASENNKYRQYTTYGTYRLTVSLPAGQVFAITADSATYSQKVWVNGQLLSEVGKVSDDPSSFVPGTKHYTICFTASDSPTEIIVQRANFVHYSGALMEMTLGPQETVFHIAQASMFRSLASMGVLFTAFIFFLGVSLFFPARKRFLWFSLSCLFIGIRGSFVNPKPIMILFPYLNWYVGHKLECCSMILGYFFMLAFFNAVFSHFVPKVLRYIGYGLCAAGLGVYLILPSTVYSRMTQTAVYLMAAYLVAYVFFFIFSIIRHRIDPKTPPRILMAVGVVIVMFSSLTDEILYRKTADYNISEIGMLLFIFMASLALTLQMREAEDALDEATERERQLREMNRSLTALYRMRQELMSDISHELKTPLTVISSYAGLTKMQLEKDAVNKKTPENLEMVQNEAVRLGSLVEQLKTVSSDKNQSTPSAVLTDVSITLKKAADFCKPICDKNRNHINIDTSGEELYAFYVPDSILQVLYNLITNANRHCRGSVITLKAEKFGNGVTVTVSDKGDGISPEKLEHVFERGFSGDGSSGLGLALCRDIIENGGGIIKVESAAGHGTSVIFTLPGEENTDEQR